MTVDTVSAGRFRAGRGAGSGGQTGGPWAFIRRLKRLVPIRTGAEKRFSATVRRQIASFATARRATARAAAQDWLIHDGKDRDCPEVCSMNSTMSRDAIGGRWEAWTGGED